MAGAPNRHYWQLNSPHPSHHQWSPSAGFDVVPSTPHAHHHHPQHPLPPQAPYDGYDQSVDGVLAYRPRVDDFSYPGIHHGLTSPTAMSATPQPSAVDYPDDPSFENNSDGRVEMNQEDVDAIIRNKRKVRDPKACYACHRRKVKCNRELPCDSCVKRDHPELCSYERPTKKRRIAMTTQFPRSGSDGPEVKDLSLQSGPNVTVPKEQWERINKELAQLKQQIATGVNGQADADDVDKDAIAAPEEADREGIHAPSNQMGTMHLGSRSVLAYMMGLGRSKSAQDNALHMLKDNILPNLGLDNDSVTYPFVDLWSTDNSIKDIDGLCGAIPADHLCKQFFYSYRDVACTIYPVVAEPAAFEAILDFMLANRSKIQRENLQLDPNNPMGISLPCLALIFAVMASGAQCSQISAKERELTSQVYICCSYQALRMANFLTHPSLDTIQALLIITNVLSYNMNPGVAYIFLGLVVRMAFSMGLQINQTGFSDHESWLRRRIWWAIAWQDSHFSVSYDRPTSTVLCTPDIPYAPGSTEDNRNYAETMYNIIRLTQGIIRERLFKPNSQMSWASIQKYREGVINIVSDAMPHLRERSSCGNDKQHHIERLALKLHSSYLISELCRPALRETATSNEHTPSGTPVNSPTSSNNTRRKSRTSSRSPPADPNVPQQLRRDCLRGLEGTIDAYVELTKHSELAARSWIGIQRAVSAAFLLGTVPEAAREPRIIKLLHELESCIATLTNEDPAFDGLRRTDPNLTPTGEGVSDESVWARSMTKSLSALRKLNASIANPTTGADLSGASQGISHPPRGMAMYMDNASMRATNNAMHLSMPHSVQQPGFAPGPTSAVRGVGYPPLTTAGLNAAGGVKAEPYSPTIGAGAVLGPSAPAGLIIPMSGGSAMTRDGSMPGSASGSAAGGTATAAGGRFVQPPMWNQH